MKKTQKSYATFPRESAMRNCISKKARSTYCLHVHLGLIVLLISPSILRVGKKGFVLFFPLLFGFAVAGAITGDW
ncbi:MAG: hypothetical protein KGI33_10745 [Thaumarchaeota archaeon]|nr:hypothetical protein [Nitrososphaerota archaeon]